MPVLLANNAVSRLAGSIDSNVDQVAVQPGDGSKFPSPGANQWFPLTIINSTGALEIMRVTARNGDLLTVQRGQETTQARAFVAGDRIELRVTAAVMAEKLDKSGGTIAGALAVQGDITASRAAAPNTGAVFLGSSGEKYLYFDGTNYNLPGGQLNVNGSQVWHAGNLTPANYLPLSGGTISGGLQINSTSPQVNLYDIDWGMRYLHANGGLAGFLTSTGGWACYSDNSGNFIATANIGAYSDRRHKRRIRTIEGGLELVERMRGVRYVDRRSGAKRVGVIAQEIRKVLPEVVGRGPDGLHVDYGNISGALIEAIKELSARVRALEGC